MEIQEAEQTARVEMEMERMVKAEREPEVKGKARVETEAEQAVRAELEMERVVVKAGRKTRVEMAVVPVKTEPQAPAVSESAAQH